MKNTRNLILIVEDDEKLRQTLEDFLTANHFAVLTAVDGEQALTLYYANNHLIDLILLDGMLPGMDGFEVLKTIRQYSDVPIIMLTARESEEDQLTGLTNGADNYITKPFRPLVLGAKVKALIRRNKNLVLDNSDTLECGPFSYDTTTMRFYKNGEELILSSKESALLLLFMKNPQQVFTKDMIYEHVWGNTVAVDDNAIMVYINRLRGKIEDDRQNPAYILTIRGLGYRFVP